MDLKNLRNLKDFLLLYNQISERCFKRCMNTFLSGDVSIDEDVCIKKCLEKHINGNYKMMSVFMEVEPVFTKKKIEEVQKAQAALEAQRENNVPENVT
ncbi:mitochondrial import inner membrane translocase subunit Tim10B [Colletes gigas]|uniref:mitochondrial import inner membrane translocase subunit Tim10B n=1 Tax=Colletes gigas TaxID=935657 RepID=UPI001C9B42CB|nr:mitochondrial import inner membrane translocase subunit Tim10B [Colletes gigas]